RKPAPGRTGPPARCDRNGAPAAGCGRPRRTRAPPRTDPHRTDPDSGPHYLHGRRRSGTRPPARLRCLSDQTVPPPVPAGGGPVGTERAAEIAVRPACRVIGGGGGRASCAPPAPAFPRWTGGWGMALRPRRRTRIGEAMTRKTHRRHLSAFMSV